MTVFRLGHAHNTSHRRQISLGAPTLPSPPNAEIRELSGGDRNAHALHQVLVVVEVDLAREHRTEDFAHLDEMV